MSSRGKKKTTMAKLNRDARLRERRTDKQARKQARRDAAANPPDLDPATASPDLESDVDPQDHDSAPTHDLEAALAATTSGPSEPR
jgi:hypothetical protein